MENNKERKGFVAYALTAFLIVSFFIITTTSLAFSAQPQVAAGGAHTVGLKTDGTVQRPVYTAISANLWNAPFLGVVPKTPC